MLAAIILAAVIDICFILDTFVFVPKGVDKFSRQHILDGDKTGALTKALKMSCTKIKKGQVWRLVTQVFLHVARPYRIQYRRAADSRLCFRLDPRQR